MSKFLLTAVCVALAAVGGCGGSPTAPSPGPLSITCPAALMLPSADGNAVAVAFGSPQTAGGSAPVTTSCDRQSGSPFPVGTTAVTCAARDARQRSTTCSFAVTVVRVPQIAATSFVAFGDSITEGKISTCIGVLPSMSFAQSMRLMDSIPGAPSAYPAVLQALLRGRYSAQLPTVSNQGRGGELLSDGVARLATVLASDAPQVLLLQEGANDVNSGLTPSGVAASLRTMVRSAQARGAQVFLGTLLPQRPVGQQGSCRGFGASDIAMANSEIRLVAVSEGATLVDLYQAFGGVPGDLIGVDGLHPTDGGYQRMASAFYDAIMNRLER